MLLIRECLLPNFSHIAKGFWGCLCGRGETCIHGVRKCLGLLTKIFTSLLKPTLLWLFGCLLFSSFGFLLLLLCLFSLWGSFLSLLCRLLLHSLCLSLCLSLALSFRSRLLFRLLLLSSLSLPLEQTRERVQRWLRTVHVCFSVSLFGLRVEVLEQVLQTHLIACLLLPLQEVLKLLLLLLIKRSLLLLEAFLRLYGLLLSLLDLLLQGLSPGWLSLPQHVLKALLVVALLGLIFFVCLRVEVEIEWSHRGMHEGLVCQIGTTSQLLVGLRDL